MLPRNMMCPHCGELFTYAELHERALIPTHDYPRPCRAVCPGSKQHPRNADSDRRPLWNGETPPTRKDS